MTHDTTEAVWYFADGDAERGPVTEMQVRALIGTNNLTRDDLVWKEGMEDWVPAGEVPGLFDSLPTAKEKFGKKQPAGKKEAAGKQKQRTVEPSPEKEGGSAERRKTQHEPRRTIQLDVTKPTDLFRYATFAGQPLLVAGLLLLLLVRGCDSLGDRHAARLTAKSQVAEDQFQDQWERARRPLERRQQELQAKSSPTSDEQTELETVRKRLEELNQKNGNEQDQLRDGRWRELASAARDAQANQQMWRFWREGFFWIGLFLFSSGLLVIGFTGQGPERWMCLVMLTIVVLRLLIGLPSP